MTSGMRRRVATFVLFLITVSVLSGGVWRYAYLQGLDQLRARGQADLSLVSDRLVGQLQRYRDLAVFLADHPQVEQVMYPGLPDHPGHALAAQQMSGGYGGLLSFVVKGGAGAALKAAGRLQLFHRATSLGGVESLVEHRHTIEPHTGIPEGMLRLSVGIEDVEDLGADLGQALGQ